MKSYLITGGTGFIGRSITRALAEAGNNVRVLDNNSRGNVESLSHIQKEFEYLEGDIRNPKIVRNACKNIDCVVHLAAVNGTRNFYTQPETVLDVATRGMLNIIDACLWHGVGEIFFASSSEVYQNPKVVPTPEKIPMIIPDGSNSRFSYSGGKIISELLLINYGRKYFRRTVIFRPHNVYGPEMGWEHVIPQFIMRMRKLSTNSKRTIEFPIQGNGNETRSFIYIDDFTRALMLLFKKGIHLDVYNIGTSQEVTIKKVAQLVGHFFKRRIKIIPGRLAAGGTSRRLPDISKIKKLGYNPKISLIKGINLTTQWYSDNAHRIPFTEII